MPAALAVRCPAKINLVLRVIGRRPDGYHELETVFQTIDLWDRIELRPSRSLSLVCDDERVPCDGSNLVVRAAELLARRFGRVARGELRLHKEIPVAGGLGGGSSDAAGALLLCSRAWGLEAESTALQAVAAELGADVPFFLTGGTALGRGRGDEIEALPPMREVRLLLGVPPFGVSTAAVYRAYAERVRCAAVPARDATAEAASGRLTLPGNGVSVPVLSAHKWPEGNDFGFASNDLEDVVFEHWPVLRGFRDALRARGARQALLSGSGSTVYGLFSDPESSACAERVLRRQFAGWSVSRTRTLLARVRLEPVD